MPEAHDLTGQLANGRRWGASVRREARSDVRSATPDGVTPWQGARFRASGWRVALVVAVITGALILMASVVWRPFPTALPGDVPVTAEPAPQPAPAADPPAEPRTLVSLTFNGGSPSQYRLARPILRQFGVNATFYVPTGRVDREEACCISWKQARQLYRDGDEIGATGVEGRDLTARQSTDPAKDYAYKKGQVCASRQRLSELGLDARSFAYPAGAYRYEFPDGKTLPDLVKSCGYLSARIVGGLSDAGDQQANAVPPANPYVLRTPDETSGSPIGLAELQHSVLRASRSTKQWVPLVFNEICHQGDPDYDTCMSSHRPIDDAVLRGFVRWVVAAGEAGGAPAGTGVRTVRQVMGAPDPTPLPQPRTIVSLTFDDGDFTQVRAGEILRAHGMHGTFFVISGLIDEENPYYLSWDQVRQLRQEGNEIGGHTRDHVNLTDTSRSVAERREQVCSDRRRLLDLGLDAKSFAYPEGAVDDVAETFPRDCGYASARTAGGVNPDGPLFAESVPPPDRFATAALDGPERPAGADGPNPPLRLQDLQRAVLAAASQVAEVEQDGWVQIILHRICTATDPGFPQCMAGESPIDDHTFATFLDWLQHDAPPGTVVMTVNEALTAPRR